MPDVDRLDLPHRLAAEELSGFPAEQRRVAIRMAAALAVTAVAVAIGLLHPGPSLPPAERAMLAIRTDLFVVIWLAVAIGNVARLRFLSPADIAGSAAGPSSPRIAPASAFLQNTLEQVALAVPVHVALAIAMPRPATLLAILAALLAVGRLCFALGYAKGAAARAFGFALTFYPTLAALALAIGWTLIG
ncbi:MAPEG family protein [Sphingomonas sp. KR1UV-12]|uniref:MAPEG family protein n=1 Tax=Sphingomonas aurea TaxID=3063994 RepID=A0ABT9ENI2_9SPHN|nr:MAPEG family protein [Sphingomonas sp. KR1UV-12]MDP1028381.1 MAPEG family protein [Sphingomonas sp. KR1UV-12]